MLVGAAAEAPVTAVVEAEAANAPPPSFAAELILPPECFSLFTGSFCLLEHVHFAMSLVFLLSLLGPLDLNLELDCWERDHLGGDHGAYAQVGQRTPQETTGEDDELGGPLQVLPALGHLGQEPERVVL